jgi:hypothetical protein
LQEGIPFMEGTKFSEEMRRFFGVSSRQQLGAVMSMRAGLRRNDNLAPRNEAFLASDGKRRGVPGFMLLG